MKNIKNEVQDSILLTKTIEVFQKTIDKLAKRQKILDEQLKRKNEELFNILESLSDCLIVTDLENRILLLNKATADLLGIKREKIYKKNIAEVIQSPKILQLLKTKENNITEVEIAHSQYGKKTFVFSLTQMTSLEEEKAQGYIIQLTDVTVIKDLQEEAERKNRLSTMGEIAANIAHEIRNPLTAMEIYISILQKDFKNDKEKINVLSKITSSMQSMNHIISNRLHYTKLWETDKAMLDFHELLNEFFDTVIYDKEVSVSIFSSTKNNLIALDRGLTQQLLHNLFLNALHSINNNGVIKINLHNEIKEQQAWLVLTFSDNGEGIPKELTKKIFDPFYTTKKKGTGLGLSVVYSIVEAHNGQISVKTQEGVGSTFIVKFPQD